MGAISYIVLYSLMSLTDLPGENSHFSLLLATWDVLLGETSAPQQQKFHTDNKICLESVQDL